MRTVRLRVPSPALIVACVALFAALGGSTYAATSSGTTTLHFTNVTKFKNTWRPAPAKVYARPGYARSSGVVHLRGVIYDGVGGTTAFVLPKSMRPNHYMQLVVATFNSLPPSTLVIQKDGEVVPTGDNAGTGIWLDGISFAAGE
jgi:hypothetical protein